MVVLVLPDGSKERIPAAWVGEGGGEDPAAPVVAAAADLLRLLRVISVFPPPPGTGRSRLHGSHQARRTTVQPAQLSLLPDQVPAPPSQLASQLPSPIAQAAAAIVARLIIQAAQPGSWSAPASLEAPKLADLPIEYHPQALYSRLPRTFSEAYPRRMSGSDHRYTTEPSQP